MVITLLAGLSLLAATVVLVLRAISVPRAAAAERLSEINRYGFGIPDTEVQEHARLSDAVDGTAGRLGRWAASHLGGFREEDIQKQLTAAGLYGLSPITFLGYRMICAIALPLLFGWFASVSGVSLPLSLLIVAIAAINRA